MSSVQPATSAVAPRLSVRLLRMALVLGGVALLLSMSWGGYRLWNGEPYPEVDPNVVAMRLREEAERVEEDLDGRSRFEAHNVDTGACYYRGLRSVAHIDEARQDVRSFGLDWSTTDVPRTTARASQERARGRLSEQGWKLTSENISDMGFRFEHPGTGDKVDVDWYEPTGTLAVRIHAPCGKVPDGFDE
ncbi:hypothetical protein OHB39_21965 [Streptomyces sp. NBC_00047]|uniref:hypothetical protein n=2 Tax=unclassified Streptomyces TaxID=2593676 RepID=UPI0022519A2A|nr:hypothetical protein [Streptomyces sp. NBC_00047]MCX5610219.1 hypothetical protein [Streptomyces sp. NBC_00047]